LTGPQPRSVDDEGLPRPPPVRGKAARSTLRLLESCERMMFLAIAVGLVVIGIAVFVQEIVVLARPHPQEQFALTVTRAVNSALFIVVVLELVRTIVSRLEGSGFHLQPFLVIGIVSATRDILTVGAELSLNGAQAPLARTMIELGVNVGVVLALTVALVMVRRLAKLEWV
jgi:uncharacterized membrane protein (DUF373 family)